MLLLYILSFFFSVIKEKEPSLETQLRHFQLRNYSTKGIGIASLKVFEVNSTVLEIPFGLLVTPKHVDQLAHLSELFLSFSYEAKLTVTIIFEKRYPSSSLIKKYFSGLPIKALNNFPYWTESEISIFHNREKALLVEEFRIFQKALAGTQYQQLSTWENWIYALGIIASRSFTFTNKSETYPVLVPYLDLFNCHVELKSRTGNGLRIDHENKAMVLQAEKLIEIGDEITLGYCTADNFELAWKYGFVVENNPYDCISLDKICKSLVICQHNLTESVLIATQMKDRLQLLRIRNYLTDSFLESKSRKEMLVQNEILHKAFEYRLNLLLLITREIDKYLVKSYIEFL